MAAEARHGLISNALSTSITGYQNRLSIKNLESIIIDNLRKSTKGMNIVQPLYAECGLDPSKTEKVKFPTILISNDELVSNFKATTEMLDTRFRNKDIQKMLDEEFEQIVADRNHYRSIHLKLEDYNPQEYILENSKQMPVNIKRIIDDTVYNYAEIDEEVDKTARILDPVYAINLVKETCHNLGYAFYNEYRQKTKHRIPYYIKTATDMLQILLRSHLCISNLVKKKINNYMLDIIIQKVIYKYKNSLVEPGTPAGILAAQCISEPMTQFVLDSKHRTGGQGGTKTNEIVRIQEILGAKDTDTMKNPHMVIMVKPEYENDKIKVQEISNHIEMIKFDRFISSVHIFFEKYGKPVHSGYAHEEKIIKDIERHNIGQKIPADLSKWCIRFGIDREELILKSMKLETIILAIKKEYPGVFLVYTPENANEVFIRCYIRSSMFRESRMFYEDYIFPLMENIRNVIVRGIEGLISTEVIDVIRTVEQKDGSLERTKIYGIFAIGTNLPEVLENPYIDPHRTQSDSIDEVEQIFGIVAARNKIMNELTATLKSLSNFHCSIFADEMTHSGKVTSIQKTGLQKREMANITLRLSFQTPVQVIQDAAINSLTDRISGISGPLVMGTSPKIGTTYNSVSVNEDFIKKNVKSLETVLEEL
jgi:DNA-directed RNA polymerase beta' subunit